MLSALAEFTVPSLVFCKLVLRKLVPYKLFHTTGPALSATILKPGAVSSEDSPRRFPYVPGGEA